MSEQATCGCTLPQVCSRCVWGNRPPFTLGYGDFQQQQAFPHNYPHILARSQNTLQQARPRPQAPSRNYPHVLAQSPQTYSHNYPHILSRGSPSQDFLHRDSERRPDEIPDPFFRPLEREKKEIRLILIKPGLWDDEVHCTLTLTSLLEHGPPFNCLSYCWGDYQDTRQITLEHTRFGCRSVRVRANLYAALRHLRKSDGAVLFWIDALCINQRDTQERSEQVGLMREIYEKAEAVFVWLGLCDEILESAIGFIRGIHDKFRAKCGSGRISVWTTFDAAQGQILEAIDVNGTTSTPNHKALQALHKFFRLPWFRRVWVLQEVWVASRVVVRCGYMGLDWEAVMLAGIWQGCRATEYLMPPLRENLQGGIGYLPELWVRLAACNKERQLSIIELIFEAREFDATDPRDKLFALLGLGKETYQGGALLDRQIPDYKKSKIDVYKDFTISIINQRRSLEILSAVDTFTPQPEGTSASRWIPDFDRGISVIRLLGYPRLYNAASDRLTEEAEVVEELESLKNSEPITKYWLRLRGFQLSTVRSTSPSSLEQNDEFDIQFSSIGWPPGIPGALKSIWNEMVKPLGGYPRDDDLLSAFILTITCVGFVASDSSVFGSLRPSSEQPMLHANFAAHWMRFEPGMESLPEKYIQYFKSLTIGNASYFGYLAGKACSGRRFFITDDGYMGLGPHDTRPGDAILILYGGSVPYILRPLNDQSPITNGKFIGESYVHGCMDGSAVDDHRRRQKPDQLFKIC